jgi:DNA-binding response OmpR family regulator
LAAGAVGGDGRLAAHFLARASKACPRFIQTVRPVGYRFETQGS